MNLYCPLLYVFYPRVLEKYFCKKYLLVREGLRAFIVRADDKFLGIAHLLSTQIPLGPSKNFVTALRKIRYYWSGPNFYQKMCRNLPGNGVLESGR